MSGVMRTSVVGGGAWGTALALVLNERGHDVRLWSFESEVAESIRRERSNPYLPGVALPKTLYATSDLAEALEGSQLVISVSPSQVVRSVMSDAAQYLDSSAIIVSASKGIEKGTLNRMDQVLSEELGGDIEDRFCVLSGPSFADEVAVRAPTAVVVASLDQRVADLVQGAFQTPWFRPYTNNDVVGVELAGAMKNVMALAAGMAAGLGHTHNTTAALITRGLAEMTRLGVALGARPDTFYGLAGMGDLVLTCTGSLSRNRTVGFRLGEGESLDAILSDMRAVAEGIKTAPGLKELARRCDVEIPITEQVCAIIEEGRSPAEALHSLMMRDLKPETWS